MHGIAYDAKHDEIIVPVALAAAVLVFRGGATGAEAPIRIIQGPRTQMIRPHTVTVDEQNGEIVVGDRSARAVMFFARDAQGDVAPLRIIQGKNTQLLDIMGIAVDPVRNLLVTSSQSLIGGQTGLFIFDRTAQGDVAPRAIISGPQTGIRRPWQIQADPERGRVFVGVVNNHYLPPYQLEKIREGLQPGIVIPSPWETSHTGFIGVWNITDEGDVPPVFVIKGPASELVHPSGVGFDAKHGEVYATDSVKNALFDFLVPDFFK